MRNFTVLSHFSEELLVFRLPGELAERPSENDPEYGPQHRLALNAFTLRGPPHRVGVFLNPDSEAVKHCAG